MASSSKRSWSLSSLPPEITQEIFYKTPTDALVRSKPTCKKWYALITDETFIYEHLRRSQERFIRIFDGVVQIVDPVLTRERSASPIQNEFQPPPYEIDTMVHCDGLMLCKCADHLRFANLALWNPATRKFRWVDPVDVITSSEYYGIGYSNSKKKARDDGYKIVRFTCGLEGNYEINVVPQVEIYEFKTNSWRTIGVKVDADVKITRKCVAVMGNMYWIAFRDHEEEDEEEEEEDEEEEEEEYEFIRCFDFSDETFKDVCFCPTSYVNSHLSCFNGDSLSLLQQGRSSRNIEVWVSSKLGDGDVSFSKYFSLSGPGLRALRVRDDASPVYCFVKPKSVIVWFVGVEGKGDKVRNCLTLYEIDEDGVRNEKVTERNDVHDYSRAFVCGYVYVPSLVPLP